MARTSICVDREKKLKVDQYLVPYATMEHALLHIENGNLDQAKAMLDKAKYVMHMIVELSYF